MDFIARDSWSLCLVSFCCRPSKSGRIPVAFAFYTLVFCHTVPISGSQGHGWRLRATAGKHGGKGGPLGIGHNNVTGGVTRKDLLGWPAGWSRLWVSSGPLPPGADSHASKHTRASADGRANHCHGGERTARSDQYRLSGGEGRSREHFRTGRIGRGSVMMGQGRHQEKARLCIDDRTHVCAWMGAYEPTTCRCAQVGVSKHFCAWGLP